MTFHDVLERYEPTIGIECHVQLKTVTKLFSGADNDARDQPTNSTVSPICFGFPGTLPVLNKEALTLAIRAGIALNASIPELSRFERKHYFYPDLPKGYQITQLDEPVIVGGTVQVPQVNGSVKKVHIHHAHLEEDAGKLTHPAGEKESLVDLNRAGTPLIEIVSEPDMHSPAEARAYTQELYRLMTFADVTLGDLYQGNMRFDVNISLAPKGSKELGIRAEIKNLNSFRAVEKTAEYECIRQAALLDKGEEIVQETRGWNEDKQATFPQRSKEDAHDYRYFPDPDIPPVRIAAEAVEKVKASMPRLPADYRQYFSDLGVDTSVVETLLSDKTHADAVATVKDARNAAAGRLVANWFSSIVLTKDDKTETVVPHTEDITELVDMMLNADISSSGAKEIFALLLSGQTGAKKIASDRNMLQISDEADIVRIVDEVLSEDTSKKAVDDIRSGNDKAIGYLVGQVMKRSAGRANPALATKMLKERL